MKHLNTIFKTIQLSIAITLFGLTTAHAQQPTVKVPPGCEVVVTGSGPGVVLGFGGTVGSGGIVVMPDPFDIPGTSGEFTYIPNGTTVTGWGLSGDLSVQTTNTPPAAPVQGSGAVVSLNIESYNKNLRPAEYAPLSPLSDKRWGRSKGRVTLSYSQPPCNNAISFEILKRYTSVSPSWVPPIIGPDCLLPNTTYTYSVDQIASDNASSAIGFDKYYWSGLPAGAFGEYTSADESSITFTTGATVPSPFTLKCNFGRSNSWDGDAGGAQTTFVTKVIGATPTAPAFSPAMITCLPTGSASFAVTMAPSSIITGYTYTWSAPGTSWSLAQSGTQNANVTVTGLDNNPGTLTLVVNNGSCLPATFTYEINRNFTTAIAISGATCVNAGSTNSYTLPANALINETTWTLPTGWAITSFNAPHSIVSINVPAGASAGAYTITARSTDCTSTSISYVVNVRPATPTITTPTPNCVVRNGGPAVTYTCTTSPGATGYTWVFPAGWSPASITTTVPTVSVTPGGTASSGVITVTAIGTSACNSATSASYPVNYTSVTPSTITTGCFSMGVAGTTTVAVANAPSPFYGTYTVSSSPATLFTPGTGYSVNASTGLITLNTLATAPAGTYVLTITHVTTNCGSTSNTYNVVVAGNGATVAITANVPGSGNCDQYSVSGRPPGSTLNWYVNGVLAVSNGTTVNIFGNALTLCGTTAPSTVCVDVILSGCTTRVCSSTVGTHGMRLSNNATSEETIEGVTIYPNPNNGNFTIKVANFKKSATAVLTDISGKRIGTYTLKKGENKIQRDGLAKGTYIVLLSIDGKTESQKIIIK